MRPRQTSGSRFLSLLAILGMAALVAHARPAMAQVDQQQTVNRAEAAVERLRGEKPMKPQFEADLAKARAVLVVPDLYKAGFVIGGQFGNGVLLVRLKDGHLGLRRLHR